MNKTKKCIPREKRKKMLGMKKINIPPPPLHHICFGHKGEGVFCPCKSLWGKAPSKLLYLRANYENQYPLLFVIYFGYKEKGCAMLASHFVGKHYLNTYTTEHCWIFICTSCSWLFSLPASRTSCPNSAKANSYSLVTLP